MAAHAQTTRSADTRLPDSTMVRRWSELFANVLEEFNRDGQDPKGIALADFSRREIRLLTDANSEREGVSVVLSERKLMNGDLQAIARDLYRAWKAAAVDHL